MDFLSLQRKTARERKSWGISAIDNDYQTVTFPLLRVPYWYSECRVEGSDMTCAVFRSLSTSRFWMFSSYCMMLRRKRIPKISPLEICTATHMIQSPYKRKHWYNKSQDNVMIRWSVFSDRCRWIYATHLFSLSTFTLCSVVDIVASHVPYYCTHSEQMDMEISEEQAAPMFGHRVSFARRVSWKSLTNKVSVF